MKVRFTRPVLAGLKILTEYIAARSPQGAQRVRQRIKSPLERLAHHPALDRQTEDPTIRRPAWGACHCLRAGGAKTVAALRS